MILWITVTWRLSLQRRNVIIRITVVLRMTVIWLFWFLKNVIEIFGPYYFWNFPCKRFTSHFKRFTEIILLPTFSWRKYLFFTSIVNLYFILIPKNFRLFLKIILDNFEKLMRFYFFFFRFRGASSKLFFLSRSSSTNFFCPKMVLWVGLLTIRLTNKKYWK